MDSVWYFAFPQATAIQLSGLITNLYRWSTMNMQLQTYSGLPCLYVNVTVNFD